MTGVLPVALICAAGGIGAALRLVVDGVIRARVPATYPVATTAINVSGSLLLGCLAGLAGYHLVPRPWQLVVGTGLLGGYTTFSTACFETVRLAEDRRYLAAALNCVGMLLTATGAAAVGLLLAWAVSG